MEAALGVSNTVNSLYGINSILASSKEECKKKIVIFMNIVRHHAVFRHEGIFFENKSNTRSTSIGCTGDEEIVRVDDVR